MRLLTRVLLAASFLPGLLFGSSQACYAQTQAASAESAAQPALQTWQRLHFLLGTWVAKTSSAGGAGANVTGDYTFREDLDGNAILRTSSFDSCSGPKAYDCQHHDTLELYREAGQVRALYVDSEGHVIHYTVTTPDAHTAVFESEPGRGPVFRLTYELQGAGTTTVMAGKFQMAAPGSVEFHSYLEWSGPRKQ